MLKCVVSGVGRSRPEGLTSPREAFNYDHGPGAAAGRENTMHKRTKSALVVSVGLAIAFTVVAVFDYTDNYVGDRFRRAVEAYRTDQGKSFSLDAFMTYYDWDSVCLVPNGSARTFKTRTGMTYEHQAVSGQVWSMVFIKEGFVVAEIPMKRSFLAYPNGLEETCFDRWHAVFRILKDSGGRLRLDYAGS